LPLPLGLVVEKAGNNPRDRLVAVADQYFFAIPYQLDVSAKSCFKVTDVHGAHGSIIANMTMLVTSVLKRIRPAEQRPRVVAPESLSEIGRSRYKCCCFWQAAFGYGFSRSPKPEPMTHSQLVEKAVRWLRHYRCGVVLSEQACANGEMPDAIGWKRASHSVLVECKVTRADFLADRAKPFRLRPEQGVGSERFYLTPAGLVKTEELPAGWGLLEICGRGVEMVHASAKNLRSAAGFRYEMNLLLASLRRVEVRIEPQSITDFLKWKNRMAEYNRGQLPEGLTAAEDEGNVFLESGASTAG
jgi:hypothetical protein